MTDELGYTPLYKEIQEQVKAGVLGSELCPEREFWHWPVLQQERLPETLKENYEYYGEIRWYG